MSHRTIANQYCDCKLQHIQFINPSCESANECRLKTAHASMLTTINKHQWAHHTQGIWQTFPHSCSTRATYHPNPPKDTLLFLLSMVPLYSPDSSSSTPSAHSLSCIVPLCLCFSISQSLFLFPHSLMCISLSLSLWNDFILHPLSHPLCDSLGFSSRTCCVTPSHFSTQLHTLRVEERREGGVAESNI